METRGDVMSLMTSEDLAWSLLVVISVFFATVYWKQTQTIQTLLLSSYAHSIKVEYDDLSIEEIKEKKDEIFKKQQERDTLKETNRTTKDLSTLPPSTTSSSSSLSYNDSNTTTIEEGDGIDEESSSTFSSIDPISSDEDIIKKQEDETEDQNNNNNQTLISSSSSSSSTLNSKILTKSGWIILNSSFIMEHVSDSVKYMIPNSSHLVGTMLMNIVDQNDVQILFDLLDKLNKSCSNNNNNNDINNNNGINIKVGLKGLDHNIIPTNLIICPHFNDNEQKVPFFFIKIQFLTQFLNYHPTLSSSSSSIITETTTTTTTLCNDDESPILTISSHHTTPQMTTCTCSSAPASPSSARIDILSHISHEIRTPINNITLCCNLLTGTGPLSVEQLDYLNMIDKSATILNELVHNILDMNQIIDGKVVVHHIDFHLPNLIEEVCSMVSAQAQAKGIQVSSYIYPHCPLEIYGDPVKLRQVLLNLITNGIKYTSKGQVVISVTPEHFDDNNLTLKFEIQDSGIGIEEDKLNILFSKFSQVHNGVHPFEKGGYGLGLAICRELVTIMDGTLTCKSNLGEGSTFTISQRFETVRLQEMACTVPNFNQLAVMVVDQNEVVRGTLCKYLMERNCNVYQVSTIEESRQELERLSELGVRVEVLLVDIDKRNIHEFEQLKEKVDAGVYGNLGLMVMACDRKIVNGLGIENTARLIKPIRQLHLATWLLLNMPDNREMVSKRNGINGSSINNIYSYHRSPSRFLSSSHSSTSFYKNYQSIQMSASLSDIRSSSLPLVAPSIPINHSLDLSALTKPSLRSRSISSSTSLPSFKSITRRHSIDIVTLEDYSLNNRNNNSNNINSASSSPAIKSSSPSVSPPSTSSPPSSTITSPQLLSKVYVNSQQLTTTEISINNSIQEEEKVNKTILVVDDDKTCEMLTKRMIQNLGHDCESTTSPTEALQHLSDHPSKYAMIFVDCEMGDMDGFEFSKLVRKLEKDYLDRPIPIIAISSHTLTDPVRKRYSDSCLNLFVSKPVTKEMLKQIIDDWS